MCIWYMNKSFVTKRLLNVKWFYHQKFSLYWMAFQLIFSL